MTVVFFVRLFYPHVGGVEKHVYNVSQELMKRGYKVILFTERYNDQLPKKDKYNGITIYRIPIKENWFKKFYIWYFIVQNRKVINKANIVHFHDVFYWYLPLRVINPKKKVFTTFHGYEGNAIPIFKAKIMHKIAEKLSNGNICIGGFYKKWYGTNPTFISYGAVNVDKKNNTSSLKTKKHYQAIFVGRLEEETGILSYLKALALLKRSKHVITLTVLGDGSQRELAERYVRKNNLSVNFKGFVQDVEKYVEKADFVFVSRYLGILESLAHKKVVYSVYNNQIKKDYLQNTPFSKYIYIAQNAKQLAEQIKTTLKDVKTVRKKEEQGYLWARGQTWSKLANLYFCLWKSPIK